MVKSKIPDRWLIYTPMGTVIPNTRFLACKVPLKEGLLKSLPEKDRFGPKDLLEACPNLALLIDLTNTTRYYFKEEITEKKIQYEKIFCPGHVVPPNSIVEKFFTVVDKFLASQKHPEAVIAVHCTHGVNRTGYFICRYMIQKMKIAPEEAIEGFQIARGHNIERQNYIDDLKNGCKGGSESDVSLTNFGGRNRRNLKRRTRPMRISDDANFTETSNYSGRMYQTQRYNNDSKRPRTNKVGNRKNREIYGDHFSAGPRNPFSTGSNDHFQTRQLISALPQDPRNYNLDRPREQIFDGPRSQSFAGTRAEKRKESEDRSRINKQASWREECRYQSPLDERNSHNPENHKETYPLPIPSQSFHIRHPPPFSSMYKWTRGSPRAQPPHMVHQGNQPFFRPPPSYSNNFNAGAHISRMPCEFQGVNSPQFRLPRPGTIDPRHSRLQAPVNRIVNPRQPHPQAPVNRIVNPRQPHPQAPVNRNVNPSHPRPQAPVNRTSHGKIKNEDRLSSIKKGK